jgi:hypothetical protein
MLEKKLYWIRVSDQTSGIFFKEKHGIYPRFGESIKDLMPTTETYLSDPYPQKTTFWEICTSFCFPESIIYVMDKCLSPFGELIYTNVEGIGEYIIFNLLSKHDSNVIDVKNSIYLTDTGEKIGHEATIEEVTSSLFVQTKSSYFHDKICSPIFYIETSYGHKIGPFCTSGFFPEEEEFISIYLKHGFTGLELHELKLS